MSRWYGSGDDDDDTSFAIFILSDQNNFKDFFFIC